jgi:hypothetical protein
MTRYRPPLPMPPWPNAIFQKPKQWFNLPENGSPEEVFPPASNRGLVLVFWDASCIHCVQEISTLNALHTFSKQGLPFQVLGVHVAEYPFGESVDWLTQQIKRLDVHTPVFADTTKVLWNRLEPSGWPHWFLISEDRALHLSTGGMDGAFKVIDLLIEMTPQTLETLKPLQESQQKRSVLMDSHLAQCSPERYFQQNSNQPPRLKEKQLTIPFQGRGVQLVGESLLPDHAPIWVECHLQSLHSEETTELPAVHPDADLEQHGSQSGFWLGEPRFYRLFQFAELFQGELTLTFANHHALPEYQLYNMTFLSTYLSTQK